MRLLDLFCGEGGAGMGYHLAGFDVVGVDNDAARLEEYPFECHQGDAIEFLLAHGHEYDVVHASPPCTGYTRGTAAIPDRMERYDRLIAATREALLIVDKPYVIENVDDAGKELIDPLRLCGFEFNLTATDDDGTPLHLKRHRWFESSVPLVGAGGCPGHPRKGGPQIAGAYGGARRDKVEARTIRKGGYVPPNIEVLRDLLGTPWMSEKGCFLSIPPVYTQHLGKQLLEHVEAQDVCLLSERVDGPKHSWEFDGDDPRIVCAWCAEVRDALSGRVLTPARSGSTNTEAPSVGAPEGGATNG